MVLRIVGATHPDTPVVDEAEPAVTSRSWIPAHRRAELRDLASRSNQVVLGAAVVGVVTGLFVAAFDEVITERALPWVRDRSPWLTAFLPMCGLVASVLIRRTVGRGVGPATSDEYLQAFHDRQHLLGLRAWAARLGAAVASLGSGVPLGLEGPSFYSGATLGSNVQRRLPRFFHDADHRTLLVAGAAAGVSAIFRAPATGAVFALEVPFQNDLARRMLLPSLVAAASGYLVFVSVHGTDPLFPIDGVPGFDVRDLGGALVVGVIAGIGARGFAKVLREAKSLATTAPPLRSAIVAGLVLAGLFGLGQWFTGEPLLVGGGHRVLEWASEPEHSALLLFGVLALRGLATPVAVAGGGVGGIFVPLVACGAVTGALIGHLVGADDMTLYLVIGVAAFLGAGYRVPLAAVMFVAETTGRPAFVVPGLLAAVAAELMMGPASVTPYQRATQR